MRVLIVLSLDLDSPEDVVGALKAVDPPSVPGFTGEARIVPEPHASELIAWLDE